ncbi:hypothetical protein HFO56_24370 [Rhizobium laguerreae]|uniref:hypothetical protein n=1 Tax=Rhizobium laguerreae TaxID=1076926 RepID=UPI001C918026|nr:hypothetical protein [Rhizobium laguerreae]MBY3155466.1 hypothetical protein [Rhizobium laguerreae]
MNRAIISIATFLSLSAGASVVAQDDLFDGPFAGNCGDEVQCTADFKRSGKDYIMDVRVSDGKDDQRTICQFIVPMKTLAFDVLIGELDGVQVRVAHMPTEDVVISGLPKDGCSGAVVNGPYRQFFDE